MQRTTIKQCDFHDHFIIVPVYNMASLIIEAFVNKSSRSKKPPHEIAVANWLTSMSWTSVEVAQVQISAVERPNGLLGHQSFQDSEASFTSISIPTFSNSKCIGVRELMYAFSSAVRDSMKMQ